MDFIESAVPDFLRAMSDETDTFSLSNEIKTDLENSGFTVKTYLVRTGLSNIYLLEVILFNNQFQANMVKIDNDLLNRVVCNSEPFCLIHYQNHLLLCTINDYSWLTIRSSQRSLSEDIGCDREMNVAVFSDHFIEKTEQTRYNNISLGVPIITNQQDPNGNWLCWAACCAAIIKFRTGYTYSAVTLYNALHNAYSESVYGLPCGTPAWIQRAYSMHNLTYHYYADTLYEENVLELMEAYIPILFGLYNNSNMYNATLGHNVVCRSYEDTGTTIILGFMDPNYTYYKYTYTSELQFPDAFIYDTYTPYWCYTIY